MRLSHDPRFDALQSLHRRHLSTPEAKSKKAGFSLRGFSDDCFSCRLCDMAAGCRLTPRYTTQI